MSNKEKQMSNREHTEFMSDWIHEQEKARIKLEHEKWLKKTKEKKEAAVTYKGNLLEERRKLGML